MHIWGMRGVSSGVTWHLDLLLRDAHLVAREHRVHLLDRPKLLVDQPLLLADVREVPHRRAHVVEVVHLAAEQPAHLVEPRRDPVELGLRLLVEVDGVLRFPRRRLRLEGVLERRRLEGERADVVDGRDLLDLGLDGDVPVVEGGRAEG